MNSPNLISEREFHFSTLLPLSVEARELSSVLDRYIYEPVNTSNTLDTRIRVWRFMQEVLWVKEEFSPEHSRAFFTQRFPSVEKRMEATRERFSQRFNSVIYWNLELESLNHSLQSQYQFLLRTQLLLREWELQKPFLKKLWNNFDHEWELVPICRPIEKTHFIQGDKKIH